MVFVVVHLFICFLSCSFKNNRKEGTYLKDQQHQTNSKKSFKKCIFFPIVQFSVLTVDMFNLALMQPMLKVL